MASTEKKLDGNVDFFHANKAIYLACAAEGEKKMGIDWIIYEIDPIAKCVCVRYLTFDCYGMWINCDR